MNILVITPSPIDTTSFYRAWGVLPYLKGDIHLISDKGKQMSWVDIAQMDIIFMHRPYTVEQLRFARYAKEMHIPLWMDYDDDLTRIPEWMSFHSMYMNDETQQIIKALIGIADVVTVSTPDLAARFSELNKTIFTIPNALNDYMLDTTPAPYPEKKIILWRGSETHHMDLFAYVEHIRKCITREDWEWTYMGFNPWYLPKTRHIPTMDPIMYFRTLKSLQPGLMFVPLIDDTFNRCKSNIAWLEATYAGAVCLVPEWESWNQKGSMKYDGGAEFETQLQWLMSGESIFVRKAAYEQSWNTIHESLLLSKVNQQRETVINLLKK